MAKAVHVGNGNIARKVKQIYIGVDGKARKVKRGYIGVNGVARLFWASSSGGVLSLTVTGSGTTANLSWVNPTADSNWYKTVIVMKKGSAPTSITDGTEIYRGTGSSTNKSGLSYNSTYYFAAFAIDDSGEYDPENFPTGYYSTPTEYAVVMYENGADPSGLTGSFRTSEAWSRDEHNYYDEGGTFSYSTSYGGTNCMMSSCWTENGGYTNHYFLTAATRNMVDFTNIVRLEVTCCVVESTYGSAGQTGNYTNMQYNGPGFFISTEDSNSGLNPLGGFQITTTMTTHTIDCSSIGGNFYMYFENSSNSGSKNTVYIKKIVAYKNA